MSEGKGDLKQMPVKEHYQMLSKQFLLSTTQPSHPNHSDLHNMPDPKHRKRETLKIKYAADILPLTADGITDPTNLKEGLKTLHTTSVRETIANQNPNKSSTRTCTPCKLQREVPAS